MPTPNQSTRTTPAHRARRIAWATVSLVALLGIAITRRHATAESAVSATLGDSTPQVYVDLSERKLRLSLGDSTVDSYTVAIGRNSMPTPRGTFRIRKIVWNPAWIPPDREWARNKVAQDPGAKNNPMKVVKMFFKEPDYYIHGTNDVESLGDAASHGCLRMDPDDAYRLARYLMTHGGSPRDENWFWRVLHFRSETKTVYLDNPIAITIE